MVKMQYDELVCEIDEAQRERDAAVESKRVAVNLTDRALAMAARLITERDEARAVARHYYQWNRSAMSYRERVEEIALEWEVVAKAAESQHDEARLHLRQLLHALDNQRDGDGNAHLSWNVRAQMRQARRLLQEGDGED